MRTFTYILVYISALACAGCQQNTNNDGRQKDLFTEGYETILTELLRARLLISIDNHDMLFEKDILPHDNFYITSTGITYIYQRYEISSYAVGIIEVTIPWEDIKDILK